MDREAPTSIHSMSIYYQGDTAMSRTLFHKHHIIPRHAGGTDDPSNLIYLTVEEHAEAHRLLFEQYGRWQDELAWKALSGAIGKDEIIYRKVSPNLGKKLSDETRKKMSENNPMKRKEISEKSGNTRSGTNRSNETKLKISLKMKGKAQSEEAKQKRSESMKHYHKERKANQSLICER